MMYDGRGATGLFMVFMALFWIALIVVIVWLVVKLWPTSGRSQSTPPVTTTPTPGAVGPPETPEQILDRMFALGEIDEATYRARRTALAEMKQQP